MKLFYSIILLSISSGSFLSAQISLEHINNKFYIGDERIKSKSHMLYILEDFPMAQKAYLKSYRQRKIAKIQGRASEFTSISRDFPISPKHARVFTRQPALWSVPE